MGFKVYIAVVVLLFTGLPIAFTLNNNTNVWRENTPRVDEVYFKDVGPMICRGLVCKPQFETMCLRTAQQCHFINDPWHHIYETATCPDPYAPGHVVFYSSADRFCYKSV